MHIIAITSLLILGISLAIMPSVKAASIADNVGVATGTNQNNSAIAAATANPGSGAIAGVGVLANERLSTTGSTDQPVRATGPQAIILEVLPKKVMGTIGKPLDIVIVAKGENGTGIPGVKIKAQIASYLKGNEAVRLGGTTDDKGVLIVTPIIGEHAPSGQFLVTATASKEGFNTTSVSSGFAAEDGAAAAASSSSGGSSSKCSGSSCK